MPRGLVSLLSRAGLAVIVITILSCGGGGTEPIAPVVPVLTTVTVTLSAPTIQVAQTTSATAGGFDQNGAPMSVGSVTWSTTSASVASVTTAGSVTGVSPGQATIIAFAGGKQGQQSITVLAAAVASVTVSPSAPWVVVGGTQQLTAMTFDAVGATLTGRTITWTTSDATKATVSATGLVTAVAVGTATITATSEGKSGTSTVTVTPATQPDLVLDVVTAPSTGTIGGTIAVVATVRNQGTSAAGAFRLGVYFSTDATITTADVLGAWCDYSAGLAVNTASDCSGSITVPSTLAPGTYYVGAIADDQGQVSESNESNNARASATPTVLSTGTKPDLVLDAVTAPSTGTIGGTIAVAATVRNQGTSAAGAFRLGFYYSTDATITTADVFSGAKCDYTGLAANTASDCTGSITVPSTLAPGTYYVGAIADDQGQVSESNESNNARASATTTTLTTGGGSLNLFIDGMYLTQATQTYTGTVPLVAGRTAYLRVFVRATQANSATPAVRVRFYQNGSLVDTRTIPAGGTSVPTSITEGVLSSSWNLSVAGTMIKPGLSILADVDPTNAITESTKTDNSFPVSGTPMTLDVRTVSTFNVMLVPVVQTPNGLRGDVTDANKDTYMEFANRVYPLLTYNATVHAPYSYGSALVGSSYDITWTTLLSEMSALRLAEGSSRNYYGVIKPAYSYGGTGYGYIGGPAAVGVDWTSSVTGSNTSLRSMTAAHEWGHNFNRRHVDCGSPSSPDPLYPYATTSIGMYGYDITSNQLLAPATYADLMTYCTPLFVSDYTYKGVLDYRAAQAGQTLSAAPQRSLLVWGRIGPEGVVLEPSFEIDAPPSLPTRAGPYSVQATDDVGHEIFNLSFEGEAIDHAPNERQFAFVVPLSATGTKPTALRLVANGHESILRSVVQTSAPGAVAAALASVRLSPSSGSRSRLEWDAASYPMALIRDPATGQVLSFARGGRVDLTLPGQDIDVIFSDGVSSVRRLVPITLR